MAKNSLQKAEMNKQADSMLAVITRAAADPKVDIQKMQSLLDMQERIMNKQAEIAFNQAMTRLQKKLPSITKKGMIEFTDKKGTDRKTAFARYEDIAAAIRPLMIAEGFSISFNSEWNDNGAKIIATLSHSEGYHRSAEMRLPLDTSGSKNNLQAMGSTISYGKRYLVGMLLNIITVGEDDDGKIGGGEPAKNEFAALVQADRPADLAELLQKTNAVMLVLSGIKTKSMRIEIINQNIELLQRLANSGNQRMVDDIHALAEEGE